IGERLRVAASMLRAPDDTARRALTEYLREGSREVQSWLKLAAAERSSPARDIASLRQAGQSTTAILLWVDAADRCPDDALPSDLRMSLSQTLVEMASVLVRGGYPVDIAVGEPAADTPPLTARTARIWSNLKSLVVRFCEPPATVPRK